MTSRPAWHTRIGQRKDIAFLRSYYGVMPIKDIAKKLRRSYGAVCIKASHMGITAQLRNDVDDRTAETWAKVLGVSQACVNAWVCRGVLHLDEEFGDLDSVGGGTLPHVVADNPEGESMFNAVIGAHSADKNLIAPGCIRRQWIGVVHRVVDNCDPLHSSEGSTSLVRAEGSREFNMDRFRVTSLNRNSYSRSRDAKTR